MKRKNVLLFSLVLLFLSTAYAQTNPIDPARRVAWNPGIPEGIPERTTICATFSPGATAAQINSAIQSCPAGQVVFLNAGTYNISGINFAGKSNVTLRGAGPDQTFLVFSGQNGCLGGSFAASICIATTGNPDAPVSWTAGYSKGTTQITLSDTSQIAAGTLLLLDQRNDSSDPGDIYICTAAAECVYEGGAGAHRVDTVGCSGDECRRSMIQVVIATAVAGNVVTISPGLYMPNWRADRVPEAWPITPVTGVGIENLSMDHSGTSNAAGITIWHGYKNWIKNVRSLMAGRAHVWMVRTARTVIRDSYFWNSRGAGGSTAYGIELRITSDTLIENNIIDRTTGSVTLGSSGGGDVIAYNFGNDQVYTSPTAWMISFGSMHGIVHMALFEGNDANSIQSDPTHGTRNFNTMFRNRLNGWEPGKTMQTIPVYGYAYGRYHNAVGNVLGEQGYHTNYETFPPNGPTDYKTIYAYGWSDGIETSQSTGVPDDVLTATSLMRWGNCDIVTDTCRFEASEVPTGISPYGNPVPSNQSLLNSLYLLGRPSFFNTALGSVPFPAIGPDVTGGDVPDVNGHAYKIPARLCYENTPEDASGILIFNADNCYGTTPLPAPPTNLTVVVQ